MKNTILDGLLTKTSAAAILELEELTHKLHSLHARTNRKYHSNN